MNENMLAGFRNRLEEVASEKIYETQCPFCSMQCKKKVIEERTPSRYVYHTVGMDNPTTHGRLCVKGENAYQHAFHSERLKHPLIKENGEFKKATWEEALTLIKKRTEEIGNEFGANAHSVYGGGSLTNEEAYLLGKFARVGLGTKYIDYNGRFCMSAAASASTKTFGIDRGLTNQLAEIEEAKCIILAGTNIAECQPTFVPYFEKAKENGSFIIVIDPRETETSAMADLHLKIKPGYDQALAKRIASYLIKEDLIDEEFCRERTNGLDELLAYLQEEANHTSYEEMDVTEREVLEAAHRFGRAQTGMIFTARGVEQQTDGHESVRHFLNLLLLTGKIGKDGCGYGAITGQANGQGGREHGQKSDQLPGYRKIDNKADRQYIADVWGIRESELPDKGVSAHEMMPLMETGKIRSLFLFGSNPLLSNPHADRVRRGFSELSFMVVADMFLTESAAYADVVLPTTSYLEDEGTLTNVEGRVTLREASKRTPGKARHDWRILADIAKQLGKGEFFSFSSAEEIFNELRLASKGGKADYYGITYDRIREEHGVFWPCRAEGTADEKQMFTEQFATADGKAELFYNPAATHEKEETDDAYPLYLTTGRTMSHYLTGEQTRRSSRLFAREIESTVHIHPETAEKYELKHGEQVILTSARGETIVRCTHSKKIRQDTVFVPMHWGGKQNINNVVDGTLDPDCGMPGFKRSAVALKPITQKVAISAN
ncbi:assimilatory nitrate reductase catalytic subunit NasC [Salsuginibacillus kocurii]|uniref:assimilatory nitrate reductase catalytic subunit NasC n=1 Tax=Salsuginibacillus kocurii TaxID=427078 RepID=UPI00036663D7|nr:molybdopterin oxidoreductase family protein [Salsuginibacillus kocurii]